MLTFTQFGDTPASVAARINGEPDASLADKIWQENLTTYACEMTGRNGMYDVYRPVWVPGFSCLDEQPDLRAYLKEKLEFILLHGRMNLAKLEKRGVDINHMMSVAKTVQMHNDHQKAENGSILTSIGVHATGEFTKRGLERLTEPAEHFTQEIELLNKKTLAFIKATEVNDRGLIAAARAELKATHKAVLVSLDKQAKFYTARLSMRTKKELNSFSRIAWRGKNSGILIGDLLDVERISKIAHWGKFTRLGGFIFSFIVGGAEVWETHKEGGDVIQTILGGAAENIVAYEAGAALMMIFTPVGWVVLICTLVIDTLALLAAGDTVKEITEDSYAWAKNHFEKWV